MKKVLFISIMVLSIFACSEDDAIELLQPTIETIKSEGIAIGDIITIPGKNFNENGTYSVKFNGTEGKITEIKPTSIKVKVPENATSGDITLTYDEITTILGTIIITRFPTVENITPEETKTGDIITIKGFDFVTSESYTVKFKELEGKVIEITSTSLKIRIPQGATSGEVSLTYKNETKVIGHISILETFVCGFYETDIQGEHVNQIVKIDKTTGSKKFVADLSSFSFGYYESLVYDSQSKSIIGLFNDTKLIKVNVHSGKVTTVNIASESDNESIKEIVIGDNDDLYGFYETDIQGEHVNQIVKVDKTTGSKIFVADLSSFSYGYYESLVYDSQSKSIIGLFNDTKLIKVNVQSGKVTTVNIASESDNESIKEIVIGDNDDLYGFYETDIQGEHVNQIVKVDKTTGSKVFVADLSSFNYGYYESLVYDSQSKSIIGLFNDTKLMKVNVQSGKVTTVNIASESDNESIKEIVSVTL
ncbi:IPT/TIG domain-containing protein [Ancylomarina subtilis]|uniref:IPT/TIG domain-containing protein n=1 Tax=Ancylomarina subtilis TaxID=1639035 RepID=A0A4Q7V6W9_9BACT|nr:IPT/TIG domain-containing protein [Ancylomarina subtilis]RZT92366.1 IPT/TIG domain-containing protein [Ancylomarina subtilis]